MAGCVVNGSMLVGLASGVDKLDKPTGSVGTATVQYTSPRLVFSYVNRLLNTGNQY